MIISQTESKLRNYLVFSTDTECMHTFQHISLIIFKKHSISLRIIKPHRRIIFIFVLRTNCKTITDRIS